MRLRALVLVATLSMPLTLLADTGYSYTGNDFTSVTPGFFDAYTTSDSVTGSFSVTSPLGDNFSGTVTPTWYSFSDGVQTDDPTDSGIVNFDITTDATGAITGWDINVGSGYYVGSGFFELTGITIDSSTGDSGGDFLGGSASNTSPGTWSAPYDAAPAPEPGSMALLGTGLLGIAGAWRRRLARS
jgi:hypothetical protein